MEAVHEPLLKVRCAGQRQTGTFSSMKRLFGSSLRSKKKTAMHNETLCKILCHNLVVLIHEMSKLGIEPDFWVDKQVA
jgi:hypothetical protein